MSDIEWEFELDVEGTPEEVQNATERWVQLVKEAADER